MSSSSSTTSTRAGRASIALMVGAAIRLTRRFQGLFSEGSRAMATRSRAHTTRRKPPPKRRPAAKKRASPRLERHHLDLIGLGLVAFAVFLAFVIWLRWDGGEVGTAVVDGCRWLVGAVHVVAPVAAMTAGALLVLRPVLPAMRPVRAGTLCLLAGLLLGLTAGTLGMGPGGHHLRNFDVAYAKTHGGMAGEALFAAVSAAFGTVGAHIVTVFLFVAAALLLTGASVASVIRATSDSVTASTRRVRTGATEVTRTVRRTRGPAEELEDLERRPARVRARPPEPEPDPLAEEPFWPELEVEAAALEPEP